MGEIVPQQLLKKAVVALHMGENHKVIFLYTVQEFQAVAEIVLRSSAFVRRALKLGGEKAIDPIIVLRVVHPAIRIEDD